MGLPLARRVGERAVRGIALGSAWIGMGRVGRCGRAAIAGCFLWEGYWRGRLGVVMLRGCWGEVWWPHQLLVVISGGVGMGRHAP